MSMERGPDCGSKHGRDDNSFGWEQVIIIMMMMMMMMMMMDDDQDNDDYWGRRGLWADCCTDKMACFRVTILHLLYLFIYSQNHVHWTQCSLSILLFPGLSWRTQIGCFQL